MILLPHQPRASMWQGIERWSCRLCAYDSFDQRSVHLHIQAKHKGQLVPKLEMPLSLVAQPVKDSNMWPMISCIMPTKDRLQFAAQATEYFIQQTYPNRQLIIVEDGEKTLQNVYSSHFLFDNHVQIISLGKDKIFPVGGKRNTAIQRSEGAIIAHWDDDEWQSPNRLMLQYEALPENKDMCGTATPIFGNYETKQLYIWQEAKSLSVAGSTMFYRKRLWLKHRFLNISVGEDVAFLENILPQKIHKMAYSGFNVSWVHGRNTASTRDLTLGPFEKLDEQFP